MDNHPDCMKCGGKLKSGQVLCESCEPDFNKEKDVFLTIIDALKDYPRKNRLRILTAAYRFYE